MPCSYSSSFELAERAGAFARELYRDGLRPAEIVRELAPFVTDRGWSFNSVMLVSIARQAFALSIAECKRAPGSGRPSDDEAAFDAYFTPLIEAKRATWDSQPVEQHSSDASVHDRRV